LSDILFTPTCSKKEGTLPRSTGGNELAHVA
jgi:hypothetical protein